MSFDDKVLVGTCGFNCVLLGVLFAKAVAGQADIYDGIVGGLLAAIITVCFGKVRDAIFPGQHKQ